MRVLQTLARLYVDDLDNALPALCELVGRDGPQYRFTYGDLELAGLDGMLLVAGTDEALRPFRRVQTTVQVDDLDAARELVERHGGRILAGPQAVPTGWNMTARQAGGAVIEYVQHHDDFRSRRAVTGA